MDPAIHEAVIAQLGRKPKAPYMVCVVDETFRPVVIENAPFCFDGEPMPTRFWLVGKDEVAIVGMIESTGGVNEAETELAPEDLVQLHKRYAIERDADIGEGKRPRPTGGVGGTARGVKCLHAHFAHWLVTGDDVVGAWTHAKLQDQSLLTHTYKQLTPEEQTWWNGEAL